MKQLMVVGKVFIIDCLNVVKRPRNKLPYNGPEIPTPTKQLLIAKYYKLLCGHMAGYCPNRCHYPGLKSYIHLIRPVYLAHDPFRRCLFFAVEKQGPISFPRCPLEDWQKTTDINLYWMIRGIFGVLYGDLSHTWRTKLVMHVMCNGFYFFLYFNVII